VADLDYVTDADYADDRDKLDLYLPKGRRDFPVLLWLHGGALMGGDKEEGAHIGRRFAGAGIGTVVINYRLSPDVIHPAHVQDAATAVAWVKAHILEFGGNPDAIFVAGHSAGAYLTALLALDERYLAERQLKLTAISGAISVSGYFYVERVAPHRDKSVRGEDPAKWPDASPARYVRPNALPMLLLYADGDEDWRREQNKEMAAALKHAGHPDAGIRQVDDRDHATIGSKIGEGDEVSNLILEFIARRVRMPQN
jgi:acetyl esterase/lipase